MRCDSCGKKKPTREILDEEKDKGPVNWCDECIEESEAVSLEPVREDGQLMAVDATDVNSYGDFSIEYIDSEDQLDSGQRLVREARIKKESLLEKEI